MATAALVDLDSLPRKLMQELSVFADDIISLFDRANRTKDELAKLSLDISAVKHELKENKDLQIRLEEQMQEKTDETRLKSQNIEKLEFRLLTVQRNSKSLNCYLLAL